MYPQVSEGPTLSYHLINSLRWGQNVRYFAGGIFKCIFLKKNSGILMRFHFSLFQNVLCQWVNIGPGNVLAPYRRHAIIWTSGDIITEASVYASPGPICQLSKSRSWFVHWLNTDCASRSMQANLDSFSWYFLLSKQIIQTWPTKSLEISRYLESCGPIASEAWLNITSIAVL